MKNKTIACTFFGHRSRDYSEYREKIETILVDLIENHGVTQFYNCYRGEFDWLCAGIVKKLKDRYPHIKNILVPSFYPKPDFLLPYFFDETVCLLESNVSPKLAVNYTNRKIVKASEFIISGVVHHSGNAWTACEYARRQKKRIIDIT